MRTPSVSRRRRGFVMVLVLVVIAALAVLASALYLEAESNLITAQSVTAQQIATSRADLGLQTAIARLRSANLGGVNVEALVPCDLTQRNNDPFECPASSTIRSPQITGALPFDAGNAQSLAQGGGLQYAYVIYARSLPAATGIAPTGLLTIRAIGYYGYSPTDPKLVTSIVEAELMPTRPEGVRCKGDNYSCG